MSGKRFRGTLLASTSLIQKSANPSSCPRLSAGSGNLFGNDGMSVEWDRPAQQVLLRTVERGADPRAEFRGGEQPGGFDHPALAMRPLGLDRIEPGALDGQVAGEEPHALATGLHLPI